MRPPIDHVRSLSSPYCNGLFFIEGWCATSDGARFHVVVKGATEPLALKRLFRDAAERASVLAADNNRVWLAENPISARGLRIVPIDVFGPDWRPNLHGCAAHNLCTSAKYLAALDLFRSRAVERWWLQRHRPHRVLLCGPIGNDLGKKIDALREQASLPRRTELFALDHHAGVFVVAALSSDPDGNRMAIAFAAHIDWTQAALRAVHDVMSAELETADLLGAELDGLPIQKGTRRALVRDRQLALQKRYDEDLAQSDPVDLTRIQTSWPSSLETLIHAAARAGSQLLFIDMTQEKIEMPVSRAIFHAKPHLPFQSRVSGPLPF